MVGREGTVVDLRVEMRFMLRALTAGRNPQKGVHGARKGPAINLSSFDSLCKAGNDCRDCYTSRIPLCRDRSGAKAREQDVIAVRSCIVK